MRPLAPCGFFIRPQKESLSDGMCEQDTFFSFLEALFGTRDRLSPIFFTEIPEIQADVMIILSKVQKKLKGHSFHPRRVYDDLAEHEDLVHRDDDERVPAPLDARVKVAAARSRDAVP
jgi:hypothetical protein